MLQSTLDKYADEYQWWQQSIHNQIVPWYRGELQSVDFYTTIPRCTNRGPDTVQDAIRAVRSEIVAFYPERQLMLDRNRDYGLMLDIGSGPMCPTAVLKGLTFAVDVGFSAYREMGYPVEDWGAVLIQAQSEDLWMLPSGMFDTVLSHNALNHVDDFEQTISEMERLAKPGSFWRLQTEYHEPTIAEPILLSDQRVLSAFHRFQPRKIREQVATDRSFVLWQVGE